MHWKSWMVLFDSVRCCSALMKLSEVHGWCVATLERQQREVIRLLCPCTAIELAVVVSSLVQLQTLQLQFNDILTIGSTRVLFSFQPLALLLGSGLTCLTRLQSLRIDSNKLSSIQSDELLKSVQLKVIDVSNNALGNLHVRQRTYPNSISSTCSFFLVYQHAFIAHRNSCVPLFSQEFAKSMSTSPLSNRPRSLQQSTDEHQPVEKSTIAPHPSPSEQSNSRHTGSQRARSSERTRLGSQSCCVLAHCLRETNRSASSPCRSQSDSFLERHRKLHCSHRQRECRVLG